MADKFHPSELLNFSIQHEIILAAGAIPLTLLTIYVIKTIYHNLKIGYLIDIQRFSLSVFIKKELSWNVIISTIILLLASWGSLILILISEPLQGIVILPTSWGTFLALLAYCKIKFNEREI